MLTGTAGAPSEYFTPGNPFSNSLIFGGHPPLCASCPQQSLCFFSFFFPSLGVNPGNKAGMPVKSLAVAPRTINVTAERG